MPAPVRPRGLPEGAQWLAGEGGGSWFHISASNGDYMVSRFSPTGKEECSGLFDIAGEGQLLLHLPFRFVHLSHCAKVTIAQGSYSFILSRVGNCPDPL